MIRPIRQLPETFDRRTSAATAQFVNGVPVKVSIQLHSYRQCGLPP